MTISINQIFYIIGYVIITLISLLCIWTNIENSFGLKGKVFITFVVTLIIFLSSYFTINKTCTEDECNKLTKCSCIV